MILDEIFRAGSYLFIACIIFAAYWAAKDYASGARSSVLFKGFLWCIGIALITTLTMGEPTCIEKDDPMYGGCVEYADDGYEPTTEQRVARFAYTMTLLYVPVIFGAFNRTPKPESKET